MNYKNLAITSLLSMEISLAQVNAYLQTAAMIVSLLAGIIALFKSSKK